jgi:hypothetical protein
MASAGFEPAILGTMSKEDCAAWSLLVSKQAVYKYFSEWNRLAEHAALMSEEQMIGPTDFFLTDEKRHV